MIVSLPKTGHSAVQRCACFPERKDEDQCVDEGNSRLIGDF
jgi:hypothetical protein